MCLTGFTRADILARHTEHCNGVNGRPTKVEMRKEGENILKFQNYHKQMKAPFVTYADFEALIQNIPQDRREKTSCTETTDKHEACGLAYTVVRCDGESEPIVKYRQGVDGQTNAEEVFLECILKTEKCLREILKTQAEREMTSCDSVELQKGTELSHMQRKHYEA